MELRLINALGQVLMEEGLALHQGELNFTVDRSGLAAGFYWLEVGLDGKGRA